MCTESAQNVVEDPRADSDDVQEPTRLKGQQNHQYLLHDLSTLKLPIKEWLNELYIFERTPNTLEKTQRKNSDIFFDQITTMFCLG